MPVTLIRSTIQATIKSTLQGVTGVENVYEDFPRANDVDEFIAKFMESDETNLQFWVITRIASPPNTSENASRIPVRSVWYNHQFDISLWYGIKTDDSETKFQALIDVVLGVFADKRTLSGCYVPVPLGLYSVRNDVKNQVQCRVASFSVVVVEQQNGLTPT